MKKYFLALTVSLSLIFAGSALAAEGNDEGIFKRAENSIDASLKQTKEFFADSAITTRIKKRLGKDAYVSTFDFSITTNSGVVTVKGETSSEKIAQRVVDITRATMGVADVDNQIVIVSKSRSSSR